jgi:hypothetical protein
MDPPVSAKVARPGQNTAVSALDWEREKKEGFSGVSFCSFISLF